VRDANYKRLDSSRIQREDLYQVVSYMYRLRAKLGALLYPSGKPIVENKVYKMKEESYGNASAYLKTVPLKIAQDKENFSSFVSEIEKNEEALMKGFININL